MNRFQGVRRLGAAACATAILAPATLCQPASAANLRDAERATHGAGAVSAAAPGRLVVRVAGLPPGARPVGTIAGPGVRRALSGRRTTIRRARAGLWTVSLRHVELRRGWRTARRGARVFPVQRRIVRRVRPGRRTTLVARYGTIVNPRVRKAPRGLLSVQGDPSNPTALVYGAGGSVPARGEILAAAPSELLPAGLMVRVASVRRKGARRVVAVVPVPVTEAVPTFDFEGELKLQPVAGADPFAGAAKSSCKGPDLFDIGARLDELTVRRASAGLFPPQMSFTLAVRTTEWFGTKAAVAGVSCSWDVAQLGPWQGAIPTPVVPIPVYATIPVKVAADVEGSLSAFRLNLASTSVMDLDLGRRNDFSLRQEGVPAFSATLSLQLGVGNPKVGDLHVKAGLGPKATWRSGQGCSVDLALGSLSAGAKIGPLKAGTPSWTPFSFNLWRGCRGGEEQAPAPPPPPPAPVRPPAIRFAGDPGTEAPPTTLGPYAMTAFPADSRPAPSEVLDVPGPTGTVAFGGPLTHHLVGDTWETWSHGYTGSVYSTSGAEIVLTLPPGTGAMYLYAEPNVYDLYEVSATSQDGTTSGPVEVHGEAGARYFGFYATCGATLDTVRVTTTEDADGLAVGELGIAPITGGSSPCPD
jgi:hypothetical protein